MTLRFLFVDRTPGHFPILSGFLSTEGFKSRSYCTYTSNEYFVIDGGYCSERVPPASSAEMRGAGRRNEECCQRTSAIDYVACRVFRYRCFYHTRKTRSTKWPIRMFFCVYVDFIHHQIRTWWNSHFKLACMLIFYFLYRLFLSGSPKRAHFRRRNFLHLSKKWVFYSH